MAARRMSSGRSAGGFTAGRDRVLIINFTHFDGREAFGALGDFVFDHFAIAQAAEAVAFNNGVVDKHVLPLGVKYEAETLFAVKPFHCAYGHTFTSAELNLPWRAPGTRAHNDMADLPQMSRLNCEAESVVR